MPTLSRLSGAIRSLGTSTPIYIERRGTVANDEGGVTNVVESTITVTGAVVHPLSGRDRQLLPEGVRSREAISLFWTEPVRVAEEFGDMADVILYTPFGGTQGRYVAQVSEDWGHVAGHWRVMASREPRA